LAETGIGHW